MSVCIDTCTKTQMIPTCLDNLIIGTISALNTAVFVYIEDLTTQSKPVRYSETSDGAGLVTVTGLITDPDFMPNHSYKLWVTLATATSIEDREIVTINAVTFTCFELRFEYVKDSSNDNISYTSITLTPC